MMKDILLYLIKTYKKFPHAGKCRFVPTCSTYAYDAISKYGCIKGSILSIKRFLNLKDLLNAIPGIRQNSMILFLNCF